MASSKSRRFVPFKFAGIGVKFKRIPSSTKEISWTAFLFSALAAIKCSFWQNGTSNVTAKFLVFCLPKDFPSIKSSTSGRLVYILTGNMTGSFPCCIPERCVQSRLAMECLDARQLYNNSIYL